LGELGKLFDMREVIAKILKEIPIQHQGNQRNIRET
jgi:hypothetical protein